MKALILDGSQTDDRVAESIRAALDGELSARGAEVELVRVAEKQIGPCMGDFFCWVRSPGMCAIDDDNRAITRSFVNADLVIYLSPISFGGYSSELKRALDHLIPSIMPFFTMVDGEIHHAKRYPRYPRLLAIGWLPGADPTTEAIFHHLVHRNGVNMHAPNTISGVVNARQSADEIQQSVHGWLEAVQSSRRKLRLALPVDQPDQAGDFDAPQRALLLIGSPRGKTSSSQMLGGYLFERLAERGIQTETIRLQTVLKSEEQQQALLQAVDAADLVMLAAPLYIDSLSSPTTRMLELIAASRRNSSGARLQRFGAIMNCGFPEAAHNNTALAICRDFARLAGFEWAGGLALGGGEGLVHGAPLEEGGGRTMSIRQSLSLAAEALAVGKPVPPEAVALMAKPVIAPWLYLIMGVYGWTQQARKYNVHRHMGARPYAGVAGRSL